MEEKLVVFTVGNINVGVPVKDVDRVVFACEVTPLPGAPSVVRGVVDVHGCLAPVFDINSRFGLPFVDVNLNDCFIICNTRGRKVVLHVDNVRGVEPYSPEAVVVSEDILPGMVHMEGLVRIAEDMVLVQNLSKFLSLEEEKRLDEALEKLKQT